MFFLPDAEYVIKIHEEILESFGGLAGVRNRHALESAVNRPEDIIYYDTASTIHDVCAALMQSLACNHAFIDGNKRTALLTVISVYEMNQSAIDGSQSTNDKLEELVLGAVEEKLSVEQISSKLAEIISVDQLENLSDISVKRISQ